MINQNGYFPIYQEHWKDAELKKEACTDVLFRSMSYWNGSGHIWVGFVWTMIGTLPGHKICFY